MTALFEVGISDVADTSDDCYTPRWIFDAAGLIFDMDVAAPVDPTRRTCPAARYLTPLEDGLSQPWEGLVWMNPPYSRCSPWVERFAMQRCGLALLPAVKEVYWLGSLLGCADAMALIGADFARPDGSVKKPPLLILAGCGSVAAEAVGRIAAADKYLSGAYHVRPGVLAMATTRVVLSGPLFTGQASEAAAAFTDSLAHEIAEIGKTWIQIEAHGMDRSGRGGTGQAAEGVKLSGGNGAYIISGGISQGKYAWPWLEGTSKRNASTGFSGYHTFRRTRLRMRKQVTPFAQARLEQYLLMMGGTET